MKKVLFLSVFVCLTALSIFAQDKKATDFSGTWTLDAGKSKLDERARVESMTLTVAQTDKEVKIETATKLLPAPADGLTQGDGGQGAAGMRRGGFTGDGTRVYSLDGNETTTEAEGRMGKQLVKSKGEIDGGKLKLSSVRVMNTQRGEVSITTRETWTLSSDGKTLTIKREMETPRGTNSSEMVFTKK